MLKYLLIFICFILLLGFLFSLLCAIRVSSLSDRAIEKFELEQQLKSLKEEEKRHAE